MTRARSAYTIFHFAGGGSAAAAAAVAAVVGVVGVVAAGCAAAPRIPPPVAEAALVDAAGTAVGTALFTQAADGSVAIALNAGNLPAGTHGIHVHTVGACDAPAFTTAGGHFTPTNRSHGLENPAGTHGGDLPNLVADASGHATYRANTNRITLSAGPLSIFDADGSALVIHAGPDDQRSDPSGDSGARLACGVIRVR
jgi:Cu-Zn family superoxide dismutase